MFKILWKRFKTILKGVSITVFKAFLENLQKSSEDFGNHREISDVLDTMRKHLQKLKTIGQGSQNVSDEKANQEEEAAGEDISAPERRRNEQPREVRGHAPLGNFEN